MAFTKKISSVLKGNIANFATSKALGFLGGNMPSTDQVEKVAAKIANKSPVDLSDSPLAHMEPQSNPFNYGNLYYPEETSNLGDGHYIIFDIIQNIKSNYQFETFDNKGKLVTQSGDIVGEKKRKDALRSSKLKSQGFQNSDEIIRKQSSGQAATNETHNILADSIILYTPNAETKFSYKVNYENIDAGLAGLLAGIFDGEKILSKAGAALGTFSEAVLKGALEIVLPGFGGVIDKRRGFATNPQTELVFKSVPFRSFNFPFEFAPRNEKEKDTVHKIIQLFKFHMQPELSNSTGFLIAPSEFQITYMYRDKANMYIPKISRCALTDFTVDYSPEGVFTTYKPDERGAPPTLIKVDMAFTEMEIMTKKTIGLGH